jgi:UDP-glcNAc-lipooligosaccharide N-acetylglucosamine glycosyltransferase
MNTKDFPLVSVLIPAYNHENYIQETIESVINQTYPNIELIILDDGSKDKTWEKITELKPKCENRFVKIHFETKQNEGTCITLNKLLKLSSGEFVYIIASDDLAKPQAIEKEVKFLQNNPDYALAVGDNEYVDSMGKQIFRTQKAFTSNIKNAKYKTVKEFLSSKLKIDFLSDDFGSYKTLYKENYIPNGYLIRKNIFETIGNFTKNAPLEDFWLMLQISKYKKMKYIDEILFSYRIHDTNTIGNSTRMRELTTQTRNYEQKLLEKYLTNHKNDELLKIYNEGICYYQTGIPNILMLYKYQKINTRTLKVEIFNKTIYSKNKLF